MVCKQQAVAMTGNGQELGQAAGSRMPQRVRHPLTAVRGACYPTPTRMVVNADDQTDFAHSVSPLVDIAREEFAMAVHGSDVMAWATNVHRHSIAANTPI